jgi:hypothetical protein
MDLRLSLTAGRGLQHLFRSGRVDGRGWRLDPAQALLDGSAAGRPVAMVVAGIGLTGERELVADDDHVVGVQVGPGRG